MLLRTFCIAMLVLAAGGLSPIQAAVVYVDAAAAGTEDGTSWASAFSDLQDGIAAAADGDEIWIATGTYTPHASDPAATFLLDKGITLIGGFAGSETSDGDADPDLNPTILSGDIDGDNPAGVQSAADYAGNAYHVVTIDGVTAQLANLTIQHGGRGAWNLTDPTYRGGGVRVVNGAQLNMFTCLVRYNYTAIGAGLYVDGSRAFLFDSTIFLNRAVANGAGLSAYHALDIGITDCRFDNVPDWEGGIYGGHGIYLLDSSSDLEGTTVTGFSASTGAGITYADDDDATNVHQLQGCTVSACQTFSYSAALWVGDNADLTIRRSRLVGNLTSTDAAFTAADAAGALFIQDATGLRIENSLIVGNQATTGAAAITSTHFDDEGIAIYGTTIADNRGSGAATIELHRTPDPLGWGTILGCILWNNSGEEPAIQSSGIPSFTVIDSIVEGGHSGGTRIVDSHPLFMGPGAWSGTGATAVFTDGDYRLWEASPARDVVAAWPAASEALDYRGDPRPLGPAFDAGAHEWGNHRVVSLSIVGVDTAEVSVTHDGTGLEVPLDAPSDTFVMTSLDASRSHLFLLEAVMAGMSAN